MVSSGNFCTLNRIAADSGDAQSKMATLSKGNLHTSRGTNDRYNQAIGTHGVATGKWYTEWYISDAGYPSWLVGWFYGRIMGTYDGTNVANVANISSFGYFTGSTVYLTEFGNTDTNSGNINISSWTNQGTPTTGDIIMNCMDFDAGKGWWGINGVWGDIGSGAGDPANGTNPSITWTAANYTDVKFPFTLNWAQSSTAGEITFNAGQDSTFSGAIAAGGNADGNGFGDFKYSVPAGFLSLCSANLSVSDDIDPAKTDSNIGDKQVNAVTYTGNGTSVNVTGFGFAPDLCWIKMRSPHGYNNMIFDSSRGVTKHLSSDRAATEFTTATSLTSFDSDGFTYGTENSGNDSGDSFVAWGWKANGGTTVTNNDGSVTSSVQANTEAGFSIVTFTGINSATTATVGHGLGKAPTAIMHFCRTSATYPFFRIKGATSASTLRNTNPNGSPTDVSGSGGALSDPTSSVFSINNYTGVGGGGFDYVAYCWAPIDGYSSFGNFTGNGNVDGPFIYTGFRPKIIVIIGEPYGRENIIWDSTRDTHNAANKYLRWGRTSNEGTGTTTFGTIDFLSNGFKIRQSGGDINGSGENVLYMAWGDVPFKYNNSF